MHCNSLYRSPRHRIYFYIMIVFDAINKLQVSDRIDYFKKRATAQHILLKVTLGQQKSAKMFVLKTLLYRVFFDWSAQKMT